MASIFVFGSNLAGRHGAGSALEAVKNHGAVYGNGHGPQGNSYAIPTKDANLRVLPLLIIAEYVIEFLQYAKKYPKLTFNVVEIGCGLAGYRREVIAPMFKGYPSNVILSQDFQDIIWLQVEDDKRKQTREG